MINSFKQKQGCKMKKLQGVLILFTLLTFMGCGGSTTQINAREETKTEQTNYKEKFINSEICNQIIDNEFIVMCYDYKLKASKSVAYTLDGDLMNEPNIKDRPHFYREKSLEKKYQIGTTDYTNSGYDRGHLAPDAAFDWSQESLDAVYTLANIIPQAPQVNRNSWASLEKYVRAKAVAFGELKVVNVIKYGQRSKRMGKNKMAISKGYYKVLYNKNENYEECFYYDNKLGVSARGDTVEKHKVLCESVTN